DVFHPLFFRADGPHVPWEDVDGDGQFTPGIDAVVIDGNTYVLRVLSSVVTSPFGTKAQFHSDDPSLDIGMDWLYADADGSGAREFGPEAGFTEADPTYGERLFVVDDANRNGRVDIGERLVALGTSKVRAIRLGNKVYRRGIDLVDTPVAPEAFHGTG